MKEMEAKELRVGNIVRYADSVYLDGGKVTEVGDIIQYETDYYQPIPLTEEWLLKFGIYDLNTLSFKMGDLFYDLENKELGICGAESCTSEMIFYSKCEYVHQLQNLYFALTGTELKYNERK
jgi:hypothetical protein